MTWSHPSTHPTTHQTIHPPMGGEFFTDFKSSNGIEISWLVQALSNFYWFWGSTPWGGGRWVHGGGVGMGVWEGVPCTHTCTCTYKRMHMHVKHANHAKHGCLHVSGHLQFLYMYTCVYVRECACMLVCGGTPPHAPRCPWHPPTHLPPPQSRREPKTAKFNKSWTNQDNSILFKDSLPLNIPELI